MQALSRARARTHTYTQTHHIPHLHRIYDYTPDAWWRCDLSARIIEEGISVCVECRPTWSAPAAAAAARWRWLYTLYRRTAARAHVIHAAV